MEKGRVSVARRGGKLRGFLYIALRMKTHPPTRIHDLCVLPCSFLSIVFHPRLIFQLQKLCFLFHTQILFPSKTPLISESGVGQEAMTPFLSMEEEVAQLSGIQILPSCQACRRAPNSPETSGTLLSLFLGTEFKIENPGLGFTCLEKVEKMPVEVREIENDDVLILPARKPAPMELEGLGQ